MRANKLIEENFGTVQFNDRFDEPTIPTTANWTCNNLYSGFVKKMYELDFNAPKLSTTTFKFVVMDGQLIEVID